MCDLFNKLSNIFVKPLLKSPLHRLVSSQFMLITFVGRKSGQKYTTPVQYVREEDCYIFFTNKGRRWWKNLLSGRSVILRLRGEDVVGIPEIIDDAAAIEQWLKRAYPRMSPEQVTRLVSQTIMVRIAAWQPEFAHAH